MDPQVQQALVTINAILRTKVVANLQEIEAALKALNLIAETVDKLSSADGQPNEAA